jgi:hypothetical protein
MVEQVIKDKDYQMEIGKSDGLIVLRVWESHAHGEVIHKGEPDLGLFILMSTQRQVYKMKGLDRIISKAARDRKCKFTSLVHLVNEENLKACFKNLKANKASGVDFVTKHEYSQNFEENIKGLVDRLKSKSYRPQPVRRVYIPLVGWENTLAS